MRLHPRSLLNITLILSDSIGVNLGYIGTYLLLYQREIADTFLPPSSRAVALFLLCFNLVCGSVFVAYRLYAFKRAISRIDEAYKVFVAMTLATLMASLIATLTGLPFTTWNLIGAWAASTLLVVVLRNLHRSLLYVARLRGFDRARAVIIGTGEIGQMIAQVIGRARHLGYDLVGFISDEHPVGSTVQGLPVLGQHSDLRRVVQSEDIHEVLIALSGVPSHQVVEFVAECQDEPVSIKIYPDTFQIITNNEVSLGDLEGLPLLSVKSTPLDQQFNRALKRGLDLLGAGLGLIVLSPLMLLIGALIWLEDRGSVFFVQERVGVNGQPFPTLKFRSMRVSAEANGPGWTTANDSRKTRIGSFIRRYSLDELPQLINVLLGEMSLVGPRPEQPHFVQQFSARIPRYMSRHKQKAGLTGWAQVNGLRGDTSIEERTRYDLYYVENWSLLFDIKIIIRTIATVFQRGNNAY